jgi:RimJ/RimL family protein N-acetyltransferase
MDFIYGHDKEIAQFVATLSGVQLTSPDFGRCKTIGIIDGDGNLIAGMVYFNYKPEAATIEMGLASTTTRWFNRAIYRRIFEYPFIDCGCQMLLAYVRADNERMLSELARLNFNLTMVPRLYGQADDGVLCTLTDDQWLDCKIAKRVYRDVNARKEMEAA